MGRPPLRIKLPRKDRTHLKRLLKSGVQQVRTVMRALALLQLADGKSAPQIAGNVPLCSQAVRDIARRYQKGGLDGALYDKSRPGAAPLLSEKERKRIVAMVCGDPPGGFARWTVRLVAQEAVKRKVVPRVGRETIRILLLHDDFKPWWEKNVGRRETGPGVHRADGRSSGGV